MRVLFLVITVLSLWSCSSTGDGSVGDPASLSDFKRGCQVKLLDNGRGAFLHRIMMIRSAKESIELQTFIWTADECGRILFHELREAAKRGVKVRIICDHLFSTQDSSALAAISRTENLEIKIYNPAGDSLRPDALVIMLESIGNFHKMNQRMHNKLLLVDSKNGVCGGRNIEDTYYDNSLGLNFRDLDVAIRGPVTKEMKKSFEQFWASPICISMTSLKDVAAKMHENITLKLELDKNRLYQKLPELLPDYDWQAGFMEVEKMAFFSDMPGKNDSKNFSGSSRLNNFIVETLKNAEDRIWIQSPYLVLSNKAKQNFTDIRKANEKLDIKISTNSLAATDSWPTYAFLYRQKKMLIGDLNIEVYELNPMPGDMLEIMPNYSELLELKAGLKSLSKEQWQTGNISLYPRLCMHSKCMLVDNDISFVGSYNMDPRSANLNTELSAVIIDKKFNRLLAQHIARDMAARNSWVVAKRQTVLGLKQIYSLISAIGDLGVKLTGLDLWPRRNTSCFQLKTGAKEVPQGHKDFYKNYFSVGNFPRVPILGEKEILTRFFKAFGIVLKPVL